MCACVWERKSIVYFALAFAAIGHIYITHKRVFKRAFRFIYSFGFEFSGTYAVNKIVVIWKLKASHERVKENTYSLLGGRFVFFMELKNCKLCCKKSIDWPQSKSCTFRYCKTIWSLPIYRTFITWIVWVDSLDLMSKMCNVHAKAWKASI